MVFGKACLLPIEIEYKAYMAIKKVNFDLIKGNHIFQTHELEEFLKHAHQTLQSSKKELGDSMTKY
ncbi:hypothetical protein HanIR_Chr02g0064921 [Helianthus annuus]|nr:hypothetical protein HanIR_Chr02g0064921 [Helianthus annuus]